MNSIGIDLLRISRMEQSLKNPRFIARVFSAEERSFLLRNGAYSASSAAANFAAKEAFSKAIGTGIRGFSLNEVSVLRNKEGAPYLALSGKAAAIADAMDLCFAVSLTHEGDLACAVVCAKKRQVVSLPPLSEERRKRLILRFGEDFGGARLLTREQIIGAFSPRDPLSHKGSYGKLLIFAGSPHYRGAAALCTEAALRCGAGLVTLASVPSVVDAVSAKLYEPIYLPLPSEPDGSLSGQASPVVQKAGQAASSVLVGCGLGQTAAALDAVRDVLSSSSCPLVVDADGLNLLSDHENLYQYLSGRSVLTPHVGEMSRLCGKSVSAIKEDPVQTALSFAKKTGCVIVLKDADTVIALPDGTAYLNTTGNAGMARGGSGDVLAGMIAAFLCQRFSLSQAAVCGVWLHGAAGDLARRHGSELGMLPHDMITELPYLFRFIEE